MKKCNKCGYKTFQKHDVVYWGGTHLKYKCPNCSVILRTDLQSFILMLIGAVFLLIGVLILFFKARLPIHHNLIMLIIFTTGFAIGFIGLNIVKLEVSDDT